MKEKIIKLFKTKKEIFILFTIMLVLVSTVILAAKVAGKNNQIDVPVINNVDEDKPDDENNEKDIEEEPKKVIMAPIEGEYVNLRTFYDLNSNDNSNAIIINANSYQTSKGVSFSRADNKEFECLAMASGIVTRLDKTDASGYVLEIKNDNFVTTFYNLSSVNVNLNDSVEAKMVVGKSGNSLYDTEIGNNVFVEMKVNNEYVNPIDQIGLLETQVGKIEK